MGFPMINTKCFAPPLRPHYVSRSRLTERLHVGLQQKARLSLVCAPAGYGKSVLVSQWLAELASPTLSVGWYSLDESDNDLHRFFAYIAASLSLDAQPETTNYTQQPTYTQLTHSLIADLQQLNSSIVLVLEDYHKIVTEEIHWAVQCLLSYPQTNLHVVVITREDPPFPLGRMRAKGDLTELRAEDLKFDRYEVDAFVTALLQTKLDQEAIDGLTSCTEGWVAGLQLATISLKSKDRPVDFIGSFRGNHRYVIEYLMDEVLDNLPATTRQLLCQTSIVRRFNADLCEVLTGLDQCGKRIQEIEQQNLFVSRLDDKQNWYRYHHMFADFLRTSLDPKEEKDLLQKAALYFANQELFEEAVSYALQTKDFQFTTDIVEQALKNPCAWSGGRVSTLETWLNNLPATFIRNRPELQIRASRALFLAGRLKEAGEFLDHAEGGLKDTPTRAELLSQIWTYRASLAAMYGDTKFAKELLARAKPLLTPDDLHTKARFLDTEGLVYHLTGEYELASESFIQTSGYALQAGVIYLAINGLCEAAITKIACGKLTTATALCREAIDLDSADSVTAKGHPAKGLAWSVLAEIMRLQYNLEAADDYIAKGIRLSRRGGIIDDLRSEYVFQFNLRLAQRNESGAWETLKQLEKIIDIYAAPYFKRQLRSLRVRLLLSFGRPKELDGLIQELDCRDSALLSDYERLNLIRWYLLCDQADQALRHLSFLQESAGPQRLIQLEALVLQAKAYWAQGNTTAMVGVLDQALSQASREQCNCFFLAEDLIHPDMIKYYLSQSVDRENSTYAQLLLEEMRLPPPTPGSRAPKEQLLEPLTGQEQKILTMLAAGLSNQAIADQLVISLGTVKWHIHNIYGKLSVTSRTQASAKARQLGLVI